MLLAILIFLTALSLSVSQGGVLTKNPLLLSTVTNRMSSHCCIDHIDSAALRKCTCGKLLLCSCCQRQDVKVHKDYVASLLKVISSHSGWWNLSLIVMTLIDNSWFTCMIPVRKVTDEAMRTRCSSLVRPSKPVMLTGGPSSGTNLVTTEPIIRHKTGNGPAKSENSILFFKKLIQNL